MIYSRGAVFGDLMDEPKKYKGTTTVGILCSDGVVLASDMRVSLGFTAAAKERKIYKIEENVGMAAAGVSADARSLARILSIESKLFRMRNGRQMTIESMASLLSNIMYQYKMFPFIAYLILGGREESGEPKLYAFDPYGDISKQDYFAGGSGMQLAFAILDDGYKKEKVEELIPLAVKAVNAGMKRDLFSGEGIDLVSITKQGFKRYTEEEVEKILDKIKAKKRK